MQAADLANGSLIDLRNDGHPERIKVITEGSAAYPVIVNHDDQQIEWSLRDDFDELTRWAPEISVLRVRGRFWVVAWSSGRLDATASLTAATDSGAVCRFRSVWQQPTWEILSAGKASDSALYREILLGKPLPPPSAGLDT